VCVYVNVFLRTNKPARVEGCMASGVCVRERERDRERQREKKRDRDRERARGGGRGGRE